MSEFVMRRKICELRKQSAIKAISDTKEVFFKHGVLNTYEKKPTDYAIKQIKASGYGADVSINEETNDMYVCVPTNSDMQCNTVRPS